jgi:cytochrome P450
MNPAAPGPPGAPGPESSFLEQYDAIDASQPAAKMGLFSVYVRGRPDVMFDELRRHRPIFVMPAATMVTRFADVQEVLARPKVFSVRLYAPKMDTSVGPFMLARDMTEINRRDKGIMTAMLRLDDLPQIRQMVESLSDAAISAAGGRIDVVSQLSRLVPVQVTGKYFGFPGPDTKTMMRWSRATQFQVGTVEVISMIKRLLLRDHLRRAAGADGQLDFAGGPFPEKFVLEFG